MGNKNARRKLLKTLEYNPKLKEIFLSTESIEVKRKEIQLFLSNLLFSIFEDDPQIPPLEWILTKSAINVFKNILSLRSERLAKFSMITYIDAIINQTETKDMEKPAPGFLAEFDHLIKGISGKAGLYSNEPPAFLKHHGVEAAKLRSKDLSKMAKLSEKFQDKYPVGMTRLSIQGRNRNKKRILAYFNATEENWDDWKWHVENIIQDADTLTNLIQLTSAEYDAVKLARENKIPFGITPYYLSLLDNKYHRKKDYAIRAQVIPPLTYVQKMVAAKTCNEDSMDFMLERDTSPVEGITRRYPNIVILKPIITCPQICVYCQRNWEIENVNSKNAALTSDKLTKAIDWIANTPEITEVLVTGGDPFLFTDRKLHSILSRIGQIKHIKRIRIGTRTLVTMPQRITDSLVKIVNKYHIPGISEVVIITHFEHPYEITPHSMKAVQKFRKLGISVYNQLVFTYYNSRKFEVASLRQNLRLIGVTPYYTFNTKGKDETAEYRVPIARLLQEQQEEARLLPGTVRTDEIVFNVPRLGKNYLRASQHHGIISILPSGRRVYEFHPWEKHLSLINTYIYTDVSIYDYLERLKSDGETMVHYKSIWYFY